MIGMQWEDVCYSDNMQIEKCVEETDDDWRMEEVNTRVYDELLTSLPESLPELTINDDDFTNTLSTPMLTNDDHEILCDEVFTQGEIFNLDRDFTPASPVKTGLYKRSHTANDGDETPSQKIKYEIEEPSPQQVQQMEQAQRQHEL